MNTRTGTALLLLIVLVSPARAEVRLPRIFGDGMVLQRGEPAPVWGRAEPGERVRVTLGANEVEAVADGTGNWRVALPTPGPGGPHRVVVEGTNRIVFEDVLVGEVWLCSGQSNMAFPLAKALGGRKASREADDPELRLFQVGLEPAGEPREDVPSERGWRTSRPETAEVFSGVGFFFGGALRRELGVPIGLIQSTHGGSYAVAWTSRAALERDETLGPLLDTGPFDPRAWNRPGVLYNGMLHPLIPYAIRGVAWYQGEADVRSPHLYERAFRTLVDDWRTRWDRAELPFLFVQIASFDYPEREGVPLEGPALVREAQRRSLAIPHTGMVVTNDLGDPHSIHPARKREVGERLARWALALAYDREVVPSGPLLASFAVEGREARVGFDHAVGLRTDDGEAPRGFELAGADGVFHPARARIEGETVVLASDAVPAPTAARLAWGDAVVHNLFNGEGLPASPFRTR